MSYNYDQCLSSIKEHRLKAYANTTAPDLDALQRSMDEFANLSKHCPMTPLLWMQYAKDTEVLMHGLNLLDSPGEETNNDLHQLHQIQAKKEALETSMGVLELGLAEFPGCALLHLYYLESLAEYFCQTEEEALHHLIKSESEDGGGGSDSQNARNKLSRAFQVAWQSLGKGSHVNEGLVVTDIYRLHGSFLLTSLSCKVRELSSGTRGGMDVDDDSICNIIQQLSTLCLRWSKTPMGEGSNDEMMDDFNSLWNDALLILQDEKHVQLLGQQKASLLQIVDDNRKSTSSVTNSLSTYENDIDVAMTNEGIFLPNELLQHCMDSTETDASTVGKHMQILRRADSKWDALVLVNDGRYLLGLGASETSHVFAKYASFLQRSYGSLSQKGSADNRTALHDHISEHNFSMICCVYERALSECPTVESLWMSYIKFLRGEWISIRDKQQSTSEELQLMSSTLHSISQRSVRNCPYSSNLFELRMTALGLISTSNLEPDDITAVIHEAMQLGFLNSNREAMLSMRLVAINVVKRKLLSLISQGTTSLSNNSGNNVLDTKGREYDQDDELEFNASNRKKTKTSAIQYTSLAAAAMEEVQDLIEDIRDMYEEADNYLFKNHAKWEEGKVCFWKNRCVTEAYVLGPIVLGLRNAMGNDNATTELADAETMKCFEKLVKTQKPCHPDSWREYLRYVSMSRLHFLSDESSQSSPGEVGALSAQLRQTRGLFKRAMASMRKAGKSGVAAGGVGIEFNNILLQRDYDVALSDLCRDYLEFERNFGSEESLSAALTLVRSKMANFDDSALQASVFDSSTEENGKRKLDSKESQIDDQMKDDNCAEESRAKRTKVKTNLKEPKKTDAVHKVRIGKMDYPAHPFTVHVSNLSKDTQDMDLVDAFHPIGVVAHARILREKLYGKGGHHTHGESKGCGLVQFEERMDVEKALEKNGELEIGGNIVKINRSHLPAIGVVPQGMHRVNPKGEGKMSKRNQLKKKSMQADDVEMNIGEGGKDSGSHPASKVEAGANTKNKYRTSSSPGSIKLDSLSFKPRVLKPKPKMSLGDTVKK
jgi:RNA recognition motif-containing protein